MRKIKLLLGVLLLLILAVSCGSKTNAGKKRVIKVGTDGVYAQEVGKRINADIEFTTVPWDSVFLGLESKRYDIIANEIEKTKEREEKYIFSDKYLVSAAQIIVKEGENNIKTLKDLEGKRVISAVGSNYSKTVEEI